MNNTNLENSSGNAVEVPVTLIVTPHTISTNEQAVALSKSPQNNTNILSPNNELQHIFETVILNSILKIKLDENIINNQINNSQNQINNSQNKINNNNQDNISKINTEITPQNNTRKIYNLKRSTNVPEHHKMSNASRILNASRLPAQYNILATNGLYNKISVFDQGYLGSCVSNALSFVYSLLEYKQGNYVFITPSRLFIYYNGRVLENTVPYDYGLEIYDGISTMKTNGVCDEKIWPYVISKFASKPSVICYQKANISKVLSISPVAQNLVALQTAISSGLPVIIGIDVYDSFENQSVDRTGIIPIPNVNTETLLGGHCVVLTAYNNANKLFTFRNSWGKNWGAGGNGYIPYSYITNPNLAFDFYTINSITNPRLI